MAWAAIGDAFHDDPKILAAGNAAAGLFVRAISYCADHLTDGVVPAEWVKAAGKKAEIDALVDAELWVKVQAGQDFIVPAKVTKTDKSGRATVTVQRPGYLIPNYLKHNERRDVIEKRRADNAKRQQDWRDNRRDDTGRFGS